MTDIKQQDKWYKAGWDDGRKELLEEVEKKVISARIPFKKIDYNPQWGWEEFDDTSSLVPPQETECIDHYKCTRKEDHKAGKHFTKMWWCEDCDPKKETEEPNKTSPKEDCLHKRVGPSGSNLMVWCVDCENYLYLEAKES